MSALIAALKHHDNQQQVLLQDGRKVWTCADLLRQVHDLAVFLKARRIKRLALHGDNCATWIVADLACQEAGIVCVPLSVLAPRPRLMDILQNCGIDALLTPVPEYFTPHFEAAVLVPELPFILLLQPHARTPLLPVGTGKVTFTGSVTDAPRGICLSLEQQLLQAAALVAAAGVQAPVHLCVLPLSTLLENVAGVYAPLLAGGTVVLRSMAEIGFTGSRLAEPQKFLQTLTAVQPDTLMLTPQLLQLLVQTVKRGWQVPSLKFVAVGGGRVPAELIAEAHALGLPVYESYGLSECASLVSLNTAQATKAGSCGKPLAHLQVSLEGGEVHVSGNTMLGYVDEPDSWFQDSIATGDMGRLDNEGYLHITGRSRTPLMPAYVRNVSPQWVDSELLAVPPLRGRGEARVARERSSA